MAIRPPIRPAPASAALQTRFVRGREKPRGVVWFGVGSFWGHLRHFLAAAIATEDVDSRDWMTADPPDELMERVVSALGPRAEGASLTERLERDVWIDYVADTGDDVAVSRAVARLLFARYTLPDPDYPGQELTAPRGDLLIFGGDTAYPVATAQEITNRVLVPYNQVLEELARDGEHAAPRVLLGLPGNHDWYDGLDGFGRMFRRRPDGDEEHRPSVLGVSERMLKHYADWAREFVRGGKLEKPKALVLSGYVPVQNASYFVLPLTPFVHLYGVDRQLRTVDMRQRQFMTDWHRRYPDAFPWVMMPDPLYRFAGPSRTGTDMVRAMGFDFDTTSHFLLSGDVHHYQRLRRDRMLHVIAGGGGAFLHPAPMARRRLALESEWPSPEQSRALIWQAPLKIARGRSGFLPHLLLGLLFTPTMLAGVSAPLGAPLTLSALITLFLWPVLALIGGVRRGGKTVGALSFVAAALIGFLPVFASLLLLYLFGRLGLSEHAWLLGAGVLVASCFWGAFLFGSYLSLLTLWGFEHTQAFTALDHPGYKHFLRLRVRADGKGVDGFCIGLTDPLAKEAAPVLVDTFTWRPEEEESRRTMW
ncbi:MAG TPA: hypothetical protein VM686_37970 [Polyangiaceae bacterium]|nr:hypothetical protein [Polyangiaceae bacterium]